MFVGVDLTETALHFVANFLAKQASSPYLQQFFMILDMNQRVAI
jgi:hypothetical protein